jgi:hypothetical protein
MRSRIFLALLVAASGSLLTVTLGASALAPADSATPADELKTAKRATGKYKDIARARADGYVRTGGCTVGPDGVMGTHYTNFELVADGVFDPARPEQLLYAPDTSGKGQRLIGIEYRKDDADQSLTTTEDRPTGFGRPYDGPMLGHFEGDPTHYDLHVWIYVRNPKGMFAPFNPAVSCVLALQSVRVARSLPAPGTVVRGIPVRIEVGAADSRLRAVLRLAGEDIVVGRAGKTARRAGPTTLRVLPTLRGVRALDEILAERPSVRLVLTITATQEGGQREERVRRIVLHRTASD